MSSQSFGANQNPTKRDSATESRPFSVIGPLYAESVCLITKKSLCLLTLIGFALVVLVPASSFATTVSGSTTADDAFFAFLSTNNSVLGTQVASGNFFRTVFTIPATALTPGVTNYLQLEVINVGGPGGYIGDFSLSDTGFHFASGTQSLSTDITNWAGIYNSSNFSESVQPWVMPTGGVVSFGANGVGPWGPLSGISSGALWIWPNDSSSLPGPTSPCGWCTVDFSIPISPASSAVPEPTSLLMLGSGVLGLAGVLRRRLSL